MAQYRKIPVEIEAWDVEELISCFRDKWKGLPKCINEAYEEAIITTITDNYFMIRTLEGVMKATTNDMLIKGVNGELYPCKKEIFEKTYEPI